MVWLRGKIYLLAMLAVLPHFATFFCFDACCTRKKRRAAQPVTSTSALHYLAGRGDIVLIYPKTDDFAGSLPEFSFPTAAGLRLWVLPFCLDGKGLLLPDAPALRPFFADAATDEFAVGTSSGLSQKPSGE